MNIKSVSFLWIGKEITNYEKASLLSFADKGINVNFFTYDKNLEAPSEVNMLDANDVISKDRVFENFIEKGSFAAFSNIFRYKLLTMMDTIWVDTDMILLKKYLPKGEYILTLEDKTIINGAILKIPKDSPMLHYLYTEATSVNPKDIRWGMLGPRLLTKAVETFQLREHVYEKEFFYPIHFNQIKDLFNPSKIEKIKVLVENSFTLHMWNQGIRNLGIDKNLNPPSGSYMHEVMTNLDLIKQNKKSITYRDIQAGAARHRKVKFLNKVINNINKIKKLINPSSL